MRPAHTLLAISLATFATPVAAAGNMVVVNPSGQMRIQLDIPAADDVDQTTPITQGRIELAPPEGVPVPGGRYFMLTVANLRFADFTIDRWVIEAQHVRQLAANLREVVSFTASTASPGVYTFSIPSNRASIYGGAIVNGEMKNGVDRPDSFTGTIDLNAGTFQATVVVPKHSDCGWVPHCTVDGRLTIRLSGVLGPDTDGDGVRDSADNCPRVPNPRQQSVLSPVIKPPADVALGTCLQRWVGRPETLDLCEYGPVEVSDDIPTRWPVGANVVSWTATSVSGRVSGAKQQVTVADKTPPWFAAEPKPILAEDCAAVDLVPPVVFDDCDFGPPVLTNDAPKELAPGTTVVVWTAQDKAGNVTAVKQDVTCGVKVLCEGKVPCHD
jgi:hypothetical protein